MFSSSHLYQNLASHGVANISRWAVPTAAWPAFFILESFHNYLGFK
jgi:hypothetical protein